MCWLLTSVRCPSRGHISKTNQDRPSYYGTLIGRRHRWFCCRIQIFPSDYPLLRKIRSTRHPLSERYRLNVCTADDLIEMAWRAGQLFIALRIFLLIDVSCLVELTCYNIPITTSHSMWFLYSLFAALHRVSDGLMISCLDNGCCTVLASNFIILLASACQTELLRNIYWRTINSIIIIKRLTLL